MIDLATWNLSVPVGTTPTTIDTPRLLKGFKNVYFHADTGTLFFWVPVTGSTTVNAIYPRSELRETRADGSLRNWLYPSANHFLNATLAVNQVPSSGKIVIGQIHAFQSQQPMLKLEYQYKTSKLSGNLVAKVRIRPNDTTIKTVIVAENVPLAKSFTYVINLTPGGTLNIKGANKEWHSPISATWRDKPLYFKAGAYVQDNTGNSKEGAQVTFSKLDIDHDAP